jgi:co-chaperonin GroES (HSP10)
VASDDESRAPRPHRLILPLGMRVLVQLIREEDRTDAGLYLPQGAKEAQDEARLRRAAVDLLGLR